MMRNVSPGLGVLWLLASCSTSSVVPSAAEPPAATAAGEFIVDKASLRQEGAPARLLAKLDASPYAYFRFVATPFTKRVCAAFHDERWQTPLVAIHGDAHLEQYVITAETHGLEDFDHAGLGPAVVDLVRFASSLHLACRDATMPCNADDAVAAFLKGYEMGLEAPDREHPQPGAVSRIRAMISSDPAAFCDSAESLMVPLEPTERTRVEQSWDRLVNMLLQVEPARERSFYEIKKMGTHRSGVGSALDEKILFRIEASSAAEDDDLIVEAKRQKPPQYVPCVVTLTGGGMLRPLVAAATLGRRLPEVLAYVPVREAPDAPRHFWVHSWDPGYTELSINRLQTQVELNEVSFDAGVQLGQASVYAIPESLIPQQRFANQEVFTRTKNRVKGLAKKLADEIVQAWSRYREQR